MSLSPFDSFQSRFVTYLLNFPRITRAEKTIPAVHGHVKSKEVYRLRDETYSILRYLILNFSFTPRVWSKCITN